VRYPRKQPGVVIKHSFRHSFILAALIVLATGCAGTERRPRAAGPYMEEIESPAPRGDTLMFDPNCLVR
jgi:hypothetical protein